MFVPKAGGRNTRRRQRTSSDDSVNPPKAKRQRSVLRRPDESPSDTNLGRELAKLPTPTAPNGDTTPADQINTESHLSTRVVKQGDVPGNNNEGTIVLSSTDFYTVEQLPSLPDQIRGLQSGILDSIAFSHLELRFVDTYPLKAEPLKCFFGSGHAHALALTRSHAIVWPYSTPASSPSPSETFTVSIPESCRDPQGAVPLGVLLSPATGDHPGLLVIIPSTGKVIYWETVSSAASLGLSRQKQNGIQGSTPGMLSGEYATEILNAEPSGIIAIFSSGRVAHITLRDPQGKPSVLVNFLRSNAGSGGGGIFGGIKNVFAGGSWRKEVTAVRAGGSHQRGQRDVIIATSTGLVEIWDTHWNHGNTLKKRYDLKDEILAALPENHTNSANDPELKVVDFAFSTLQSFNDAVQLSDGSWRLFLVVRSPQWLETRELFVVQVHLSGNESRVMSTHAVDLRHISASLLETSKPKIFVPKPEETAFILIGQSLVILSLTSVEESPSSQLLLDSNKLPLPFQDIIHLRSGTGHEILGSVSEDQSNDTPGAACVLMLRNFGVIRVTTLPRPGTEQDVEEPQVTAKHKLEQAVFFGAMAKNPLNLSSEGDLNFPPSEMEQASLEICRELLQSNTRFIPTTAISLEQNLRLRAKALDDLASLLSRQGNPLSRPAKWELLWAAEKIAAQRAMWKIQEACKIKNGDEEPFLSHVIGSMHDKFKTPINPQHGETDPVRQWFLRDSYRVEHIIPWIKNAIKTGRGNTSHPARALSEKILAASELFLAVTETAFRYRDEHAILYGLREDFLEDGVLSDGYEDLPEFWTSRGVGYSAAGHLLDLELDSCRSWKTPASAADTPDAHVLNQVAKNSYRHLRVIGQMHRERTRWLSAQGDPKLMDESVSIEQTHVEDRKWQLFKLAGIDHLADAVELAESFGDMGALVELIIELQDQKANQHPRTEPPSDVSKQTEIDADQLIAKYFDKFGDQWADAYFSRQIAMGYPGILFTMRKYQTAITRYLRSNPAYARLSWINDVTGEDDYNTAAASLENLALGEKDLWSHRVEISLAKLGKLATQERMDSPVVNPTLQEDVKRLDDYVEVDGIQDIVYGHIEPILQGAIDRKAEVELAVGQYGDHIFEDRPSLHEILSDALSTLIDRQVVGADGLIDILTLMGPAQLADDGESEFVRSEFHLALQVLDFGRYGQRDPSYLAALQRLIWRRCLIKDDWVARGKAAEGLNGNAHNSVADTALYRSLTACLAEPRNAGLNSLYTPLSPAEALMTDSDSEILVSRFRPEQKSRVASDLKTENDILRECIEVGKLDFWFQNLRETAEVHISPPK
ncbi:Nucleoporin N terminal [Penicillium coprophilum]|uniref:Nucleoporin N terminal n=1 Tax=Penicillium coprophilum TaxID=36646 RepID=UPI00238EB461|nr:Nucleoporin N terminal [Penicillium coprophilum]KAJ5150546.1 Nucleoporin N terminal [Penicillium coprophilum]